MKNYERYINVRVDSPHKIIHTEWTRSVSGSEFRRGLLEIQKLILKENLENWLICASVFIPPVALDQKWTIEHLFPHFLNSSLRKIAVVLPGDHFLHMLANSMIEKTYRLYGHRIQLECFSRVEHARHWLLTLDETQGALSA
ncbi:hypothetical protein ACFSRY_00605 [Pontibacter locisalis]|uniref:SpoIIAA-like n=1 Tax=Pontibacter locisalis TaxID=1719035 RepID=A0ABW5IGL5_9BACT